MSLFGCALVLFCLVAQQSASVPPGGFRECRGKLRFVGKEVPNGEDDRTTLGVSLCECADWCKSLGKGYVHVMYVPDEQQCHCQRGVAKRGEERSDTFYYVLE